MVACISAHVSKALVVAKIGINQWNLAYTFAIGLENKRDLPASHDLLFKILSKAKAWCKYSIKH